MTLAELKVAFSGNQWSEPTWTELVLEHLAENEVAKDEKGNKYPRVRGLRRVGSFITDAYMNCFSIECREDYAACKAEASVRLEGNDFMIVATAMAEATPANVNNAMIAKHLLATSESRAEGRCWTKVLKLNCLTAEEMQLGVADSATATEKPAVDMEQNENESPMTDTQRKMINSKSKKLDVNPNKIAQVVCKRENHEGKLTKILATKVIEILGAIERKEEKITEKTMGFEVLN